MIGYGERTMGEIVEAYVNPDLPPEEWDLAQLVGKVKEFIYLLEDLTPDHLQGLGMEELKAFLREQLRNAYDLKEGQIEQQRPGLMREAERFSSCSRSTHFGESICRQWMLYASQWVCGVMDRKTP